MAQRKRSLAPLAGSGARPRAGVTPSSRKRESAESPQIDVIARSARWNRRPKAKNIVKTAVLAAAKAASTAPCELAIVLADDSAIRALNRSWRGKNAPTNVLSFPAPLSPARNGASGIRGRSKARPRGRGAEPPPSPYIGDIVIAYETVAREAAAEGKPFNHHLAHLAVHGFLHLLGHNHEAERAAQRMERLERAILAAIGVPDPYAPRQARS